MPADRRRAPPSPTLTATGPAAVAAPPVLRFDRLDALRGLAIVWMTAFHFSFDLNYFRFIQQNFYRDPVWTWQRTAIVSLFLFCAGLGQAIATAQGQGWPRFWRRWRQVAGCALLVSAGSYAMFPHSFIYFGVLHGMAAMLIVARLTAGCGRALWWMGALAIAAKFGAEAVLTSPWGQPLAGAFDSRWLNWLGLIAHKPITEDYVPLVPWLGVLWWGLAAGQWLQRRRPPVLTGPLPAALQPLALLGRWSLSWYMLHQPVLIGLVAGAAWLLR